MSKCSISIVIPAYDVESYLGAALDSIKAQTEVPDELILIDDGSNDRTLDVANSYEFPFPYKVVSVENEGQGNARNIGISLARSEYVYFFDADDLLSDSFISSMKQAILDADFPDIVLFSGESFNDPAYKGNRWIDYKRGFSGVFRDRERFLDDGVANRGLFCSPCLYISKRSIWSEGRIRFGPHYHEDEAIFFPLLFECESLVVKDEVFFYRRNREGSTMTIAPNQKHVDGSLHCVWMTLSLLQKQGLSARERWHIKRRLRMFLGMYIRRARTAGVSISYQEILKTVWTTRDPALGMTVVFYALRAAESRLTRRAVRFVKSFGSLNNKN